MENFVNAMSIIATNDAARPAWVVNSFPIIKIVLACLICLCAIFLVIASICQKTEADGGMNAITGSSDTFYNRNKGASLQGKIKKWTIAISITILVLCLAFFIMNSYYGGWIA